MPCPMIKVEPGMSSNRNAKAVDTIIMAINCKDGYLWPSNIFIIRIFALGIFSLGIFALGTFALGTFALGTFALGTFVRGRI